jgi:uncharacterized protein YlzI (FlbEa/FlbD family)
MSKLSPSEIEKVRKLADASITLNNEMKQSVIEEKLRKLNASVKKLLMKKGTTFEVIAIKVVE